MKTTIDIPESVINTETGKELAQLRRKVANLEKKLKARDENKELVIKFKDCMERLKAITGDYDFWD